VSGILTVGKVLLVGFTLIKVLLRFSFVNISL